MDGGSRWAAVTVTAVAILLLQAPGHCRALEPPVFGQAFGAWDRVGGWAVESLVGPRPQRITIGSHANLQTLGTRKMLQADEELVEELHEAAEDGDVEEVKRLIPLVGDADAADDRGDTALILAAEEGHVQVMRVLLDAGADIDHQGQIGSTALWAAVSMNQLQAVEFLIQEGADVDLRNDDGATPLVISAEDGNLDLVIALLDGGAEVDGRYLLTGETPLIGAVFRDHARVVDVLIQRGADVEARTAYGFAPLHIAAAKGALDIFKMLSAAGADINTVAWSNGDTVLITAAAFHGVDVITLLVETGVDVQASNKYGQTALHTAALFPDNTNVLSLLLRQRIDLHGKTNSGITALGDAAFMGNVGNVKFLLAEGSQVDLTDTAVCGCMDSEDDQGLPFCPAGNCGTEEDIEDLNALLGIPPPKTLLQAVKAGNFTATVSMIDEGADVEEADEDGNTPLIFAAVRGLDAIARALLQAGAKVDARNVEGQTALSFAAFFGHRDVIGILSALAADVDAQDEEGFAPLHFAAEEGHLAAVEALLAAEADLNLKEFSVGATPIIAAAGASPTTDANVDILKTLIDSGAELRVNAQGGVSALHTAAVNQGSQPIMVVLIEEGIDVNALTDVGATPLDLAAYYGNMGGVEFLLHKGGEPSAGRQSKVCGCLDDADVVGLRACPPGTCRSDSQIQDLKNLLGRQPGATPRPGPETDVTQGVLNEVDCGAISDIVAQLECVASGGIGIGAAAR